MKIKAKMDMQHALPLEFETLNIELRSYNIQLLS